MDRAAKPVDPSPFVFAHEAMATVFETLRRRPGQGLCPVRRPGRPSMKWTGSRGCSAASIRRASRAACLDCGPARRCASDAKRSTCWRPPPGCRRKRPALSISISGRAGSPCLSSTSSPSGGSPTGSKSSAWRGGGAERSGPSTSTWERSGKGSPSTRRSAFSAIGASKTSSCTPERARSRRGGLRRAGGASGAVGRFPWRRRGRKPGRPAKSSSKTWP